MNKYIQTLQTFYSGKLYPVLVALLVFVGHSLGEELVFSGMIVASVVLACFICNDLRFAVSPFLCAYFLVTIEHGPNVPYYSDYFLQPQVIACLAVYAAFVISAFIFFAVKNRKLAQAPPKKGLLASILLLCGALCMNGWFSANYTIGNLGYASSFLITLPALYLFFATYVRFDRTTVDYFMHCLVVAGLLICAELLFAYFTTVRFVDGSIVKESVVLGWGVWTSIGGMLTFLMPACFYFAASHRHGWIGIVLACVELFCILLSQSRGALLCGAAIFAICMIVLCFMGENRKRNRILLLCLIGVGAIGVLLLWEKLMSVLQNFINYGFGDNGRYEIWETGWSHFKQNLVFGSGFYDSYLNEEWTMNMAPYFYHNTLIQFLAATGIVGTLAYLYHRVRTVILVFRRPNLCKTFLGICILGLLAFSMLDTLFFCIYPIMFYSLMLLAMERSEEI